MPATFHVGRLDGRVKVRPPNFSSEREVCNYLGGANCLLLGGFRPYRKAFFLVSSGEELMFQFIPLTTHGAKCSRFGSYVFPPKGTLACYGHN